MKIRGRIQDHGLKTHQRAVNIEPCDLTNVWEVEAVHKVVIENFTKRIGCPVDSLFAEKEIRLLCVDTKATTDP